MTPPFRLTQLTLAGFGVYARPTRFVFPPGPAVYVGPNESGKTTLLHGLSAVLFGLAGLADPERFGTGRFRSFARPREFWGTLEWEAEGRPHRLHRAFESHRVRLTAEGPRGTEIIFEGEHNPLGAGVHAFRAVLDERIGISSLELFQRTFCLAQPLAAETGIDADLRHLLSGSRSGRVEDVLEALFSEVKEITAATGDLGLVRPGAKRGVNQRSAGRIESVEEELRAARAAVEEGSALLERLNERNRELEEVQARIRDLRASRAGRAERLDTLRRWIESDAERGRLVHEIRSLRVAREQLAAIDGERTAIREELDGPLSAWRGAPDRFGLLLEEWRREIEEMARERAAAEARAAGRTARTEEARAARAAHLATAEEFVRWSGIDPAAIRAAWVVASSELERARAIDARLETIAGQTEARTGLGPDGLARIRRKVAAEQEAREARARLREAEAREAMESAARPRRALRPWAIAVILGLAAGLPAATGHLLGLGSAAREMLGLAGGLLLLLGLALRLATRRPAPGRLESPVGREAEKIRAALSRVETEAIRLRSGLGPFAELTGSDLDRLEERWRLLDEEETRLRSERDTLIKGIAGAAGEAGDDWTERPASALRPPLGDASRLPAAPAGTAGKLLTWLAALSPSDWDRFQAEAERRAEALRRAQELAATVARLEQAETEGRDAPGGPDTEAVGEGAADRVREAWPECPLLASEGPPDPAVLEEARRGVARAGDLREKDRQLDLSTRRVLATAGTPDREELARRAVEADSALGLLLERVAALERNDPLLAGAREEEDPLRRGTRLREAFRDESAALEEEDRALAGVDAREREILRDLARLEGTPAASVAREETRVRALQAARRELERERDARVLAWKWIGEAAEQFGSTYREDLEERITARFRVLVGNGGRRVELDDDLAVRVIGPEGERFAAAQLSQGTRDQLALAVRLAAADLLARAVPLPLFFDDPFVHYDSRRLQRLRDALERLATERQWILLTHRAELAGWGEPIRREEIRK